jgi:hypothetical protein
MHNFSTKQKVITLILSSALAACGGGSDPKPAATPAPVAVNAGSLKGSVAIGSALANATVEIKDAKGVVITTTTDAMGGYNIATANLTAPFIIRVTGGTVVTTGMANSAELYSSSVSGESVANVSTLTTLLVAQMSKQLPSEAFAKFTSSTDLLATLNDKSKIDLASKALVEYIAKELGIDASAIGNPVTASLDPTASGNAYDALLEKIKQVDPNILNNAINIVKTSGATVTIDPATETLGQCIASLSLPAELQITDTSEPAAAIYEWNGNKSVDWSGQQQFREGWFGGLYQTNLGLAPVEVDFNGEKVLRRFDVTLLDEDVTGWANGAVFPQKSIFNRYTSLDGKYNKGWQEDTYDKDGKLTLWHKKFDQVGLSDQIYNVTAATPLKSTVTRKSLGSWYSPIDVARNESLTHEVVFQGREYVPTLIGQFETCKYKQITKLEQKDITGKVTFKDVVTSTRWEAPKLGAVKIENTETETDESEKVVFYADKRTYDIIAARYNGKRYGSYDVWSGVLIGQTSSAAPEKSACDYPINGVTTGFHWLVNTDGKAAKLRYWNGTSIAEAALTYPGSTTLANFRSEISNSVDVQQNAKQVSSTWSQTLNFDPSGGTLTGSYVRNETHLQKEAGAQSYSTVCTGQYPMSIAAKKLF